MAEALGGTTSSSNGSGDRSSTRRCISGPTTRSARPGPRSGDTWPSTMDGDPTRALTGRRRTRPTSPGCRNPQQPEPGRTPLILAHAAVQTNRATSEPDSADPSLIPRRRPGTSGNAPPRGGWTERPKRFGLLPAGNSGIGNAFEVRPYPERPCAFALQVY